ncbi:MATE family efflux transporter [Halogeometricum borinquense]|uniref:MATE family efflux transporter n=1 Tax=Halogeometricum borinquense TaxID=60847 RepID=A0A6C0UMV4_9EURY|nr:MATE family efflux transporter [Halogeometricum borinquense]QIB75701.1 MATE family efflux transporter [Halogeometricum borinquense]
MSGAPGPGRAVNITDGPILKPLLVLSIPIVLTNMLQVAYNLADTFWVGRLGQDAVSALSFSWAIVFLIITLAAGFTVAGTVLVAQNKGAGNLDRISDVAGQTIAFVVALSVVFSVVGYALAPWLLQLIGATPGTEVFRLSITYTRTMFLGIPFVFAFFIFQSLLQGWGDTKTPLYLMLLGVILNVVIDPFLILGFQDNLLFEVTGLTTLQSNLYAATEFGGFGVQGAAIATITARGIGAVIAVGLLLSGRVGIHLAPSDFVLTRETVSKIFTIGAPASIEMSTQSFGITVMTALVALAGAEAVAAFGIGTRITSLVVLPALGLARGTETAVGQNLGAKQAGRAKQAVFASAGIIAGVLVVISVLVYFNAATIVSIFITGQEAATVIAIGADYLRVVGVTYVFLGVFYVVQGAYRGSGSTRLAMIFGIIGLIVLRVPPAYALVAWFDMGAMGVWYGIATANVLIVMLSGVYFLRGTWTEGVVDRERGAQEVTHGGD